MGLLRKSIPQKTNLQTAAELGIRDNNYSSARHNIWIVNFTANTWAALCSRWRLLRWFMGSKYRWLSVCVVAPQKVEDAVMAKGSGGAKGGGGGAKGKSSGGRGPSSHPGPGGNWPSTTGRVSGGHRGNAVPSKSGG